MKTVVCALAIALCTSVHQSAADAVASAPRLFAGEQTWTSAPEWGPGTDASPAFTPDGKTVYFTHSDGEKRTIMVSRLQHGRWSRATVAPFSGTWRDIEPAMSPDASYLVFVSNRPVTEGGPVLDGHYGGTPQPKSGGNIWRVNRKGDQWSKPIRLPDVVNSITSVYAPALARNGNIYFMRPDPNTDKFRLYRSEFKAGKYGTPEPLPFSNGVIADFDPVVAPDESFIIFTSGRPPIPEHHGGLFVAFFDGHTWKTPVAFQPFLIGNESRLSKDLKTLYFTATHPTLETSPATQNASATKVPQRIWQVPLTGQSAMASD